MKLKINKQWKEIPFTLATIRFPIIPGIIICTSQAEPQEDDGFLYSKGEEKIYSVEKIWVKIPSYSSENEIEINIQNFI